MTKKNKKIIILLIIFVIICIISSWKDIYFHVLLRQAEFFENEQQYSNAIDCYDQLINLNPDIYDLYFNKAVAQAYNNETQQSIQTFNYALSLKDDDPELYYNLSLLYEDVDTKKMELYLNKAMELGFELREDK